MNLVLCLKGVNIYQEFLKETIWFVCLNYTDAYSWAKNLG